MAWPQLSRGFKTGKNESFKDVVKTQACPTLECMHLIACNICKLCDLG